MALYQYVKGPPGGAVKKRKKRPALSFVLMGLGGGILIWILWPILSFAAISDDLFPQTITPVQTVSVRSKNLAVLSPVAFAAAGVDQAVPSGSELTNANAWYPTMPQKKVVTPVNTYSLSIPKLKIQDATVTVAGDDLATSLVHYGGTALPGAYGTAVIFGHSALPQFYSPTNYKTIFSLLPTLQTGDEIDISYDAVKYQYVVYEMVVYGPNDVTTLEQQFDDSYITLVTCVPPGTLWKRLNVKAKLKSA